MINSSNYIHDSKTKKDILLTLEDGDIYLLFESINAQERDRCIRVFQNVNYMSEKAGRKSFWSKSNSRLVFQHIE